MNNPTTTGEQDYCLPDELVNKMNPKHPASGEWTPVYLAEFYAAGELQEQQLCDAINAALAAERASREDYQGEAYELNLQLAAEREVTQSWFSKSLKLEAQLAAAVELLKCASSAILSEDHVKMGLALVRIRDSGLDAALAKIGGK